MDTKTVTKGFVNCGPRLSPERRAELLNSVTVGKKYEMRGGGQIALSGDELAYFLALLDPVADGEVARVVKELREVEDYERGRCNLIAAERYFDAASLLERLARELAEARAAVAIRRLPQTASARGLAGNLKYEDGWT